MEKRRSLNNLNLNGETKVLVGSFIVNDDSTIKDSELIVFGNITFSGNVEMKNSEIIVSGILHFTDAVTKISAIGTDISADTILITEFVHSKPVVFTIEDGDIFVATDLTAVAGISSNSEITVLGDLDGEDITCLNLFVNGFTECCCIKTTLDFYSLEGISASDITSRDIFTSGDIDCRNYGSINALGSIYAECGIINCSSISVGK